ncbi:MAG: PDDEXK nuclease domain-containing protein [Chromatiales bacterium]|nr:PDDEXK nuclease domain-containing protein [Chromatiales bacterium]
MKKPMTESGAFDDRHRSVFGDVSGIIDAARRPAASSVNAVMAAAHWLTGRHIVEREQEGVVKAEYGTALVGRLPADLKRRCGRGFSRPNLWQMGLFCLSNPSEQILQTPSGESTQSSSPTIRQTPSGKSANLPKRNLPKVTTGLPVDPTILQTPPAESEGEGILQTTSAESSLASIAPPFPLPWSAYVRLLSVKNERAREFHEAEVLRGGWSVRQLDRQIDSQLHDRTALSRNKAALLTRSRKVRSEDRIHLEAEIKDPFVLEYLDLKDEYSESDLEEALTSRLETFLLDLGDDLCFMGRQRRLRET